MPRFGHCESDWVKVEILMLPHFGTRLMLVVIAVLSSLVIALSTALIFYAAEKSPLGALTAGGTAFAATLGLFIGILALFLH